MLEISMQRSQYKGERSSCWVTNYLVLRAWNLVILFHLANWTHERKSHHSRKVPTIKASKEISWIEQTKQIKRGLCCVEAYYFCFRRKLQPRSVNFADCVWVYGSYFLAARRRPGDLVLQIKSTCSQNPPNHFGTNFLQYVLPGILPVNVSGSKKKKSCRARKMQ